MEKQPVDIIKTNFMIGTLIYTVSAAQWAGLPDDEVTEKIKVIETMAAKNTIKALEKAGFTIVPKENIPEVFRTS